MKLINLTGKIKYEFFETPWYNFKNKRALMNDLEI